MKLKLENPKRSLNKAFLKQRPVRSDIDLFKRNLLNLLGSIDEIEREENQKNHVRDFLRDTFYKGTNEINTKDSKDLVIHNGRDNKSTVGVIIEAKRPSNKAEMLTESKPNAKALQELVLYYLRERIEEENDEIKYLVASNIYQWYIIEAHYFENLFVRNKAFVKDYEKWRDKLKVTSDTKLFYEEIVKPFIDSLDVEIPCTYFDIRDYEKELKNTDKEDDKKLIALFKVLSPYHLLKVPFADDSNRLDEKFYKELLHIIGLEEAKEGSKSIIRRKAENRNPGSLIENAIEKLRTEGLDKLTDVKSFGDNKEEQYFNIALELAITWVNRILFLKLLEGQLVNYHKGDRQFRFLNSEMISDFDELYKLFHQVLARPIAERNAAITQKYSRVPYLNSSLFDISELEGNTIKINALDNGEELELLNSSVLKEEKKKNGKLPALDYFFKFLDAYDFASEGAEDIQEDSKTLINASVLGKVFEKINGYKDGSVFTPGFITMYMCRQAIRLAVLQKFNDTYNWKAPQFEDLKNYLADSKSTKDILGFNKTINSLHICDPAVGSGHFLVSALNEIIAIKAELGLLADDKGSRITDFEIVIENDELIVTDYEGDIFEYQLQNQKPRSSKEQRLQKTFFHEKQTLIENCLFGVDINPKSVMICRLRLWIELLKNAYYKEESNFTELETLPNIDINIKCGNSLLSRFVLDADLSKALKSIKYNMEQYRSFVNEYKNAKDREVKKGIEKIIVAIKNDFRTEINNNDPKIIKLNKASNELFQLLNQAKLFEESKVEQKQRLQKQGKLESDINKLKTEIDEIKTNSLYKNAFEWRFEFPEVVNNDGGFDGFDIIIGNPPYIQLQKLGEYANQLEKVNYITYSRTGDIYSLFYEMGYKILKQNGLLCFITSNKWMKANYGKSLRKFLSEDTLPLILIDFGNAQVFESATVDTNILLYSKSKQKGLTQTSRLIAGEYDPLNIIQHIQENYNAIDSNNWNETSWVIADGKSSDIQKKIEEQGLPLKDWNIKINYGLKTGLNEAFVINKETKDQLIKEDPKSKDVLKPLLRGRDIQSYFPDFQELWLIYIPWHFPLHENDITGASKEAEEAFKVQYRAVYNHLLKFKPELEKRNQAEVGIRYEWYALQRFGSNYWQDFSKEKIIYPNMTKYMPFVYDKGSFFINDKAFIITGNSLAFLTAFFNSKLFRFCFKDFFPELQGGTRELRKIFFETLPVKEIKEEDNVWFKLKVEDIQKRKLQKISTKNLENEIEERLFSMYSLNDKERNIVLSAPDVYSIEKDEIVSASVSESE